MTGGAGMVGRNLAEALVAQLSRSFLASGGDLRAWVQALPAGIPMSVEAPTLALVGRPWVEQARTIAQRTRAFLDSCQVPTGPRASETNT